MVSLNRTSRYTLLLLACFWWLPYTLFIGHGSSIEGDPIIDHIADGHVLHFGAIGCPLPVILYRPGKGFSCFSSSQLFDPTGAPLVYQGVVASGHKIIALDGQLIYDLSVTKNVAMMWLSLLLLLLFFIALSHYYQSRPKLKGVAFLPLSLVRFIRDRVVIPQLGRKNGVRFTSYFLTLFCYILINNILGFLPGGANVTGNVSVVLVLSGATFLLTLLNGSPAYWHHIFAPPGVPKLIYPIIVPIELMGLLIKPFTLTIRLCCNMLAGHLMLLHIIGLIFVFDTIFASFLVVPFAAALILLKLFSAVMQAYIFTLLSAMALGKAIRGH